MTPETPHLKDDSPAVTPSGTDQQHRGLLFESQEDSHWDWLFIAPNGLRTGWLIMFFAALYYLFRLLVGSLFYAAGLVGDTVTDTAPSILAGESVSLIALVGAAIIMSLLEGKSLLSYNLAGPRRALHFFTGIAAGLAALSLLVAALAAGGWLSLAPSLNSSLQSLRLAALWAIVFLAVGLLEEGLFRCYALSTLVRGINFWWALAAQAAICLYLALIGNAHGARGVYAAAALGLIPCYLVHRRAGSRAAFWQAAWITSTVFGFYHTGNGGENWIGVFAAASIGFVFCVSVRLTGSAWWAIGCHAAWDWAETFFYGTADSGMRGEGHFLTSNPIGNPLWSGGADGPEGSLLVLAAILLLLGFLLLAYARKNTSPTLIKNQVANDGAL